VPVKVGRKQHQPDKTTRDTVKLHSMVGTPQLLIAKVLGITEPTLRRHYRTELDLSSAIATANLGGKLYNKAFSGDTAALIFWMKTRAGWSETKEQAADGAPEPLKVVFNVSDAVKEVKVTRGQSSGE
jgi:hypothetical protein